MNEEYNDTFLAKWLNNELDESQLEEFEQSDDFKKFSQIIDTVDNAVVPEYDVDKNFKATLEKITHQKENSVKQTETKVRRLIPTWAYAVASCVVAFFGYMYFFDQTTHTTQLAEKLEVQLPDGSTVHLNAASNISYKTYQFKSDKKINLSGEALFNVKKGKAFSVISQQGKVTVLGTSFTVKDRSNFYNVQCFQGKVAVSTTKDSLQLSKGDGYSLINNKTKNYKLKEQEPSWIRNESVFTATNIKQVIEELERQYNITVKGKENLKPVEFSGRFTHKDINKAVKTVFTAMQIPYSIDKERNIVIKKH